MLKIGLENFQLEMDMGATYTVHTLKLMIYSCGCSTFLSSAIYYYANFNVIRHDIRPYSNTYFYQ